MTKAMLPHFAFFTDQDGTELQTYASNSSITPSCSAGVPPSGQLRRERTANSLLLHKQNAACSIILEMSYFSYHLVSLEDFRTYMNDHTGPAVLKEDSRATSNRRCNKVALDQFNMPPG